MHAKQLQQARLPAVEHVAGRAHAVRLVEHDAPAHEPRRHAERTQRRLERVRQRHVLLAVRQLAGARHHRAGGDGKGARRRRAGARVVAAHVRGEKCADVGGRVRREEEADVAGEVLKMVFIFVKILN
jgi:hypothetical protein